MQAIIGRNISFSVAAGLLALAMAVGGAGQNFPLLEMVLDLAALAGAAALLWQPRGERLTILSRCAVALAAATLILPALQLVPLPPSLWRGLPGREVVAEIDGVIGMTAWRPLTLDVEGTVRALLSLIPAIVVLFACLHLHTRERSKLLLIVGAFALVNALLGITQLATGGSMTPYPSAHSGYPIGLFVNRNHSAAFMLLAMPIIAALGARRMQGSDSKLAYLAGTLALLTIVAVVIVATTSRMALALLPLALLGSLALLFFRQSVSRVAIPSLLILGALAAGISWVGGFNRNLARFASLHDGRFDYWDDVSWALHHYGLAGTGFGTFIPVYQTAESLSSVSPAILNHAHNDFIEIVLEGGFPAIALLVAFFAIIAVAAVQLVRKRLEFNRAAPSLAAAVGILIILTFSLVDYPLRMPALSCVFALLCACLLPTPVAIPPRKDLVSTDGAPRRTPNLNTYGARAAVLASAGALAVLVLQAGVSAKSLLIDEFGIAGGWAPWSTAAHEDMADEALAASRPNEATAEALAALRLSPIDVVALRTVAMGRALAGSTRSSQSLMGIAVSLGWRDPFTQLWAIGVSQQTGEPDKAVQRAEALFQQELFFPSSLELLLRDGPTAQSLIRTLGSSPPWRAQFFKAAAQLPPGDMTKVSVLAADLNRTAAPLSAQEAQPLLQQLVASDNIGTARLLWAAAHRGNLLANGGFEQLSDRNGADAPSGWDISDEDLTTIAIQKPSQADHGRALRISAAARSGAILSQRLILAPGTYALTYLARSGAAAGVALKWQLRCDPSDLSEASQAAPTSGSKWQRLTAQFTVPIQDCPIQTLALQRPTDIHADEVWVDDVTMTPATR